MSDELDLGKGEALKNAGKDIAETKHTELLQAARNAAFQLALAHPERQCFIDDVYAELKRQGVDTDDLEPRAGCVFRSERWERVGWTKSCRVTNHARQVMVWRLK